MTAENDATDDRGGAAGSVSRSEGETGARDSAREGGGKDAEGERNASEQESGEGGGKLGDAGPGQQNGACGEDREQVAGELVERDREKEESQAAQAAKKRMRLSAASRRPARNVHGNSNPARTGA